MCRCELGSAASPAPPQAAKLIGGTATPIAEVAEAVGFRSTFHFSASFRRRYELSPRDYRNRRLRTVGGEG